MNCLIDNESFPRGQVQNQPAKEKATIQVASSIDLLINYNSVFISFPL